MSTSGAPQQVFGQAFAGHPPENHERYLVPAIGAPLATTLAAAATLRSGERLLDVAVPDIDAGLLAVARAAAAASTATPIQWVSSEGRLI
jgi:hypothetical protein